jgi:diguanylate cyclase (GGDEF)-like protein
MGDRADQWLWTQIEQRAAHGTRVAERMAAKPVDICLIEDDAQERALLFERLLQAHFTVVQADDAEQGIKLLRQYEPSVVICDLCLPGMSGVELCRRVRGERGLDGTYVIILTACKDRETKHESLNAGADDFLVKPCDFEELTARLRNGMRISQLQQSLRRAALTDGLTGLWNHAHFRELLDREFARTRRYGGEAALLMLDLDHFKAVNDTFGHEIGNQVLQAVARHLRAMVRDIDIVARYGGEEFTIICPETNLDDAVQLAERIRESIPAQTQQPQCPGMTITVSIGVSGTSDPAVHTVRDLIDQADHALYLGKRGGRNQVVRSDTADRMPQVSGLELGEVDRLQKQVISLSMQAKDLCLQSVWALVQALEARDPRTAWHSRNTTFYATRLAEAAGWSEQLRTAVANAAMLHDLGKIGVPDRVLQNPGELSEEEASILRQVPVLTCKILEPLRVFDTETLIIRHIREHFDGSGYPFGLTGSSIPIGSRLLSIAETFDALTSERPHRDKLSIDDALVQIEADAGKQFDPEFVELLARLVTTQRSRIEARIRRAQTARACELNPTGSWRPQF